MVTSPTKAIPLEAMGVYPADDKVRRDHYGRYLILPPDGEKPIGYTRATTVAETLDDAFGLFDWNAAMALTGTMMRRGLRARWEALIARSGANPWYFDAESKAECKQLVAEGAAVGGAHDRAEIGTARHALTALLDRGQPTGRFLTDEAEDDLRAYVEAMAEANIEIIPDMIERIVVLDAFKVAGMFDRLVRVPGFSLPLIADIKTGGALSWSTHTFAIQLAIYSRANALYAQGPAADGSEDVRDPMPEVDQENGLIIWLPANEARCELVLVDLTAGTEGFHKSMWTREWRKRKVTMPLGDDRFFAPTTDETLVEALEASLAAEAAKKAGQQAEVAPVIDVDQPERYRAWLQRRIDDLGRHEAARHDLLVSWPADLPGLRSDHEHTDKELATVEALLDHVERQHRRPFPEPKPGDEPEPMGPVGMVLRMFPGAVEVPSDSPPQGAA